VNSTLDFNRMEIVLLASSLSNRGEHSYRLIGEVGRALRARDLSYRVFAAKSLEPEIAEETAVFPHFTRGLYDSDSVYNNLGPILTDPSFDRLYQIWGVAPTLEFLAVQLHGLRQGQWPEDQAKFVPLEHRDWKALNNAYFADLAALPREIWAPDNLVVVTATSQNQLGGLVEFLLKLDPKKMSRTICHLMFPPDWSPSGRPSRLGRKFYDLAFKRATPLIGRKLFFTTENDAMAEIYRADFGVETGILPVPLRAVRRPQPAGRSVRLGFYGYSKRDKGFHLLPETAAICKRDGLNAEFHIQINHSQWEQATIEAERALRSLQNVRLIEGVLGSQDYLTETNKADAVLLPYDPVLFGMRGSGIFTESVAAGCPIIASEGTFAAESIKKGEAQGEMFAPYTAGACAAAIAKLLQHLPSHMERAAAKADAFARGHSGEAYVDVLMSVMTGSAHLQNTVVRKAHFESVQPRLGDRPTEG
jgi:glycosyltransferase involved in cell wall biosynthesis